MCQRLTYCSLENPWPSMNPWCAFQQTSTLPSLWNPTGEGRGPKPYTQVRPAPVDTHKHTHTHTPAHFIQAPWADLNWDRCETPLIPEGLVHYVPTMSTQGLLWAKSCGSFSNACLQIHIWVTRKRLETFPREDQPHADPTAILVNREVPVALGGRGCTSKK